MDSIESIVKDFKALYGSINTTGMITDLLDYFMRQADPLHVYKGDNVGANAMDALRLKLEEIADTKPLDVVDILDSVNDFYYEHANDLNQYLSDYNYYNGGDVLRDNPGYRPADVLILWQVNRSLAVGLVIKDVAKLLARYLLDILTSEETQ